VNRRPVLVLVCGEPGVGKTALLTEAGERAARDGARVLWGQCWLSDGTPPYWPWTQVLRDVVDISTGGDWAGLGKLLGMASFAERGAEASPAARFELFDRVARVLVRLSADAPVVVLIDDLHWADDASLELLEFLARHLHDAAVLLVGAYRDTEAPDILRRVHALAETVPLAGLDDDGVAELMAEVAGVAVAAELARKVCQRTGGNPLFVRELTRLLAARADLSAGDVALPVWLDTVKVTLERRLAALSPSCVAVLHVAAVLGTEFRLEALRPILTDAGELPDILAEAVRGKILAGEPGADVYRFSHDMFRETLYASLDLDERLRTHSRCARVLADLAGSGVRIYPAEVAGHYLAAAATSGPEAVEEAIAWCRRAAEDAVDRLAANDAIRYYHRALGLLDAGQLTAPAARSALLLGLANAHVLAGDTTAARAVFGEAAVHARRCDEAQSLARAALGVHDLGAPTGLSHAEPIALLTEAASALGDKDGPLLSRVLASLARDMHHSWEANHVARAQALAEHAADLARQLGDPSTLAHCLLALHDTIWRPASAADRLVIVEEVLGLARHARDQELYTRALLLRATARLELNDPGGYHDLAEHCHQAERSGPAHGRWQALSRRATLALIEGDIDAAADLSEQAARLGESIGEPDWPSVADGQLWECLRFTAGRRRYADIGHNGPILRTWPPWPALGLADDGELEQAGDLLADFDLDVGFRPGPRSNPEPWSMAIVGEAVAAVGTRAQREEMYRRLAPLAGFHVVTGGCASYSGSFDHYLGLLARALGHFDVATGHFNHAITMHQQIGATAWTELTRRYLSQMREAGIGPDRSPVLRNLGDTWEVSYAGQRSHLPDLKGLRDLATLIDNPGRPVHAVQLLTGAEPIAMTRGEPVLDEAAKAAFRRRLEQLDEDIDRSTERGDSYRAELARAERDTLLHELKAAAGLHGRDRRLGDDSERARKTVSSRIRDTIGRIRRHQPELADHLEATVSTGIWCCYQPTPRQPGRR
jgi:tetratricopeptide (TPR) repeat protein